jgi:hypothetical protein
MICLFGRESSSLLLGVGSTDDDRDGMRELERNRTVLHAHLSFLREFRAVSALTTFAELFPKIESGSYDSLDRGRVPVVAHHN